MNSTREIFVNYVDKINITCVIMIVASIWEPGVDTVDLLVQLVGVFL